METDIARVPVAVGVVEGGIGINFGRRHGLEDETHRDFLHDMLRSAGFRFPETVRYDRNKLGSDGKQYVDWMRLRIASDECQVNSVNPQEGVLHLREFLGGQDCMQKYGILFEVI